jgi:hypothetical protein
MGIPKIITYSVADWARHTSVYIGVLHLPRRRVGIVVVQVPSHRVEIERGGEYRAVANAVAECIWLWQLLHELHCDVPSATVAYCDKVSVVYMSKNPVHH